MGRKRRVETSEMQLELETAHAAVKDFHLLC